MTGNSHKGSPAIGGLYPADRRADMQNRSQENRPPGAFFGHVALDTLNKLQPMQKHDFSRF